MNFSVPMIGISVSLAIAGAAHADTLDFTEVGSTGIVPTTVINLSNATLTSSGDDFFVGAPGAYGDANGLGIVCASPAGNDGCEEDMEIVFDSGVFDLTFGSFGASDGDSVLVSAFNGAALVASLVVTTNTLVDFSSAGTITRLFFADSSTAAGIGWGDFSFSTGDVPVPEPAAFGLFGLGLAALGLRRRAAQAKA